MNLKNLHYFDKLGNDFDAFMSDYDVERRIALIFDELLRDVNLENRQILEVGCGTGRFSKQIVQRKGILTAMDIGPNLVSDVSTRLHCNGVVGDACNLPFDDESFDIIISSECIEHTPAPLIAVQEMCRVCKKGGTVCLTTPNKLWYPVLLLSQILKIRKFEGNENWTFPHQICNSMRHSGMVDIHKSGCHLWPFQLKITRFLLNRIDRAGRILYPCMINYGISAKKLD